MNALGSSSKWPSYDSLTSNSSLIFSESEQTEDEADVFSEGEGDGGIRKSLSGEEGITLSRNYLDFPAHSDQLHSRSKSDRPERRADETKHPESASSLGAAALASSPATPGDLAFAQKCADLQRFICPLLELLQGLKTGRFDKGLSSFQQSVAIDRLQRILGILQRPEMGEKYLQNLLQIEMMLKIWFPRVLFQATAIPSQKTTPSLRPHWCQNQLHMPVKKRKMSWSDAEDSMVPSKQRCYPDGKHGSCIRSACLPGSPKTHRAPEEATAEPAVGSCTAEHKFTYSTGTRESPATQDSSVSSSDIMTTTDST